MYDMTFSCSGCVFTEMTPGSGGYWQTGCSLNRLHKLNPKNNLEDDYAYFDRFCNTYRPSQWVALVNNDDPKTAVMREVSPPVGFFIFFNHEVDEPLKVLMKTLFSIKDQEGDHQARYVVVMNDKIEYSQQILDMLKEVFSNGKEGHQKTEYNIVRPIKDMESNFDMLDESFAQAKNGWIYVSNSTYKIPSNLLEKIHQRINIDMRRLVIVEPQDDKLNGMIFQAALFKFVKGSRPTFNEETMEMNSKNFIERVKNMDTNDTDTISTWEDFYGRPTS